MYQTIGSLINVFKQYALGHLSPPANNKHSIYKVLVPNSRKFDEGKDHKCQQIVKLKIGLASINRI